MHFQKVQKIMTRYNRYHQKKINYTSILFIILFFSINLTILGQVTGDYQSRTDGNWNTVTTWEKYNGSDWVSASDAPSSTTTGSVAILDGHTVNWNTDGSLSVPLLILEGTGSLVVAQNKTLHINSGSVVQIDGSGTIIAEGGNAVIHFNAGSICELTLNPNAAVGAVATLPIASWNATSTLRFLNPGGSLVYNNLNQSFGNVEYNRAEQTANQSDFKIAEIKGDFTVNSTGTGSLVINNSKTPHTISIGGDFTLNGGDFQLCSTTNRIAYLHFSGNMYLNGGNIAGIYGAASGFYFVGTTEQSFESSIVLNPATNQRFFYKNSGPARRINQVYQGNGVAQQTIYGYASPVGYNPIQASATLLKNMTINNPAGVALSTSQTINENLYLVSGTFNTDKTIRQTLTMANSSTIERTGGTLTTMPIFSGVVDVVYNAQAEALTTGAKLPSGVNQLPNLTVTITNTNGITAIQSFTVNGVMKMNAIDLNDTEGLLDMVINHGTYATNP